MTAELINYSSSQTKKKKKERKNPIYSDAWKIEYVVVIGCYLLLFCLVKRIIIFSRIQRERWCNCLVTLRLNLSIEPFVGGESRLRVPLPRVIQWSSILYTSIFQNYFNKEHIPLVYLKPDRKQSNRSDRFKLIQIQKL